MTTNPIADEARAAITDELVDFRDFRTLLVPTVDRLAKWDAAVERIVERIERAAEPEVHPFAIGQNVEHALFPQTYGVGVVKGYDDDSGMVLVRWAELRGEQATTVHASMLTPKVW